MLKHGQAKEAAKVMYPNDDHLERTTGHNAMAKFLALRAMAILLVGVDDARAAGRVSRWMDPVHAWQPHAAIPPGPAWGEAVIRQTTPAGGAGGRAARERGREA